MKKKTYIKALALVLGIGGFIQLALAQSSNARFMEELNLLVSRNYAEAERTSDLAETIERLAPVLGQTGEQLIYVPYRDRNGQIKLKAVVVPRNHPGMDIMRMVGDSPIP